MEDEEKRGNNNNNDFLLYYTKYRPYDSVNNINNNDNNNESLDLNEDENDNNNILNGRWSQKEHLLFIKGCLLYGNYWKKVKKYIQTRSCSQIRSHAQKYLNKLNKKYYGNKNNLNYDFNLKLTEGDIKRLVNKNKFNEKDMDDAELYILSVFKGNKDKEKSLLDENEEKEIDSFKLKSNKNKNEVEKIFNIIKVSKEEKEKLKLLEKEENNKDNIEISENDNYINEFNDNMNNNKNYINENNNEQYNNKMHKTNDKKILKENILLHKVDMNSLSQDEIFINKCLDSKDPKDLSKLLSYFGNDINFKVNDLKILGPYQDYLGLEIDNSEDNNDNNTKSKEINDNLYNIPDNSINNKNQSNIYPYIFNPSNNSFQLNPLYNHKLLINPGYMNHY